MAGFDAESFRFIYLRDRLFGEASEMGTKTLQLIWNELIKLKLSNSTSTLVFIL